MKRSSYLKSILLSIFFVSLVIIPVRSAKAQVVADFITEAMTTVKNVWDKAESTIQSALGTAGSAALNSAIKNTVTRIANDTATYLGSAGEGQKPLFVTEGWGKYAESLGDAAAGDFIDGINKWNDINLCEPSLEFKAKIGLGLVDLASDNPPAPKCTFSKMKAAWETEAGKWSDMKSGDYLQRVSSMFDPTGNDLSVSLSVMTGMEDAQRKKEDETATEVAAKGGWLDVRNIGGKQESLPGDAKSKLDQAKDVQSQSLGQFTGDALKDAANVFLNQLAITAFNKVTEKIGQMGAGAGNDEIGDMYKDLANGFQNAIDNTLDFTSDPGTSGGRLSLTTRLAKILKPRFDIRADYSVLADLTICMDSNNPGPSNCVMDDQFRQGVDEKQTIIEAISNGYLHKDWRFKRDIDFNQGYSLRSMMILRKYRIISVGWETALTRAEARGVNATLMDMVSCFDPDDNYNEFSRDFNIPDQTWCEGLVDPNWVLKAPLNYCKKEGYGNYILNKTATKSQSVAGTTIPGQLIITRADGYCADEQSCISENADGTCEAYGYCTQEKRTWTFGTESEICEPVYNTCQSFQKADGTKTAYLENTIDYGTCNSNNTGCSPYSTNGTYSIAGDKVDWQNNSAINLNSKLESCASESEGCSELIRVKLNEGHNFLIGGDFESGIYDWDQNDTLVGTSTNNATTSFNGYLSGNALNLSSAGLQKDVLLGASDYDASGQIYTLSFYAKNCSAGTMKFSLADSVKDLNADVNWNYYYTTYVFPENLHGNLIHFYIDSDCTIDNLKMELSSGPTAYSNYHDSGLIYEKLMPVYLYNTCYVNAGNGNKDYRLKDNAPAVCYDYARQCNASEAGCQIWTGQKTTLPAKVVASDYCRQECSGYDSYIQKAGYFTLAKAYNFIPSAAATCSSAAVGCSQFTNLDTLAQGGEGLEYYKQIKQCVKPAEATCSTYYSWEGYELKTFYLKQATGGDMEIVEDDSSYCDAYIFNLSPADPLYNADCRQYYDRSGNIFYHLAANTITCSDNCLAYRLDSKETLPLTQSYCNPTGAGSEYTNFKANQFYFSSTDSACYVCKNGGVFDTNQNACVYKAIPGEGEKCQASESGCREYLGASARDTRVIASYSFDQGVGDFVNLCNDLVASSSESLYRGGSSLYYDFNAGTVCNATVNLAQGFSPFAATKNFFHNIFTKINVPALADIINPAISSGHGIGVKVGTEVNQGKSYTIRFLAKAQYDMSLAVYLSDGQDKAVFNQSDNNQSGAVYVEGNNEWQWYELSLGELNHDPSQEEVLVFTASNDIYFDNVVLSENGENYYLIENSWYTPDVCYYDVFDNFKGANYNLGCSPYTDNSANTHYLRHFNNLCSDEAAGCELMVDTKNSASPEAETYASSTVEADSFIYAVYNNKYLCGAGDKGCQRLGRVVATNTDLTNQYLYADVYRKNDPDKYSSILCESADLGCQSFKDSNGSVSYFKDPAQNVCQFRTPNTTGTNLTKNWYRLAVKRCDANSDGKIAVDGNGNPTENVLCSIDNDCAVGSCILDDNDYLCSVDFLKTIGYGGQGNRIAQPSDAVGLCEISAANCTEYIDAKSDFSSNLVLNPNYETIAGIANYYWASGSQKVYLEKNKLYSLSSEGGSTATGISCVSPIRRLQGDNNFSTPALSLSIAGGTDSQIIFNSLNNSYCTVSGGALNKTVSLKPLVIDYLISSSLDKSSCNGAPSLDSGCVVFNERKSSGGSMSYLGYSADRSYNLGQMVNCQTSGVDCDSNTLIKVRPDRVCSRWLACYSKQVDSQTGEQQCYSLGECDKLNSSGDTNFCTSFVSVPTDDHNFQVARDKDATGYALLDKYFLANMREVGEDLGSDARWDFEGTTSGFDNNSTLVQDSSDMGLSSVNYPADGKGLLKIDQFSNSNTFDIEANKNYYLSYLINNKEAESTDIKIKDVNSNIIILETIGRTSGWQEKVLPFTPTNNATIYLSIESINGVSYLDNIKIEPVLRVSDDEYIAKSCRLYPGQDAISCESDNRSVNPNGLYGYCLEKDPKNNGVCLMWLPIDTVKSSQASYGANTGFNGYDGAVFNDNNQLNPNPYVCAGIDTTEFDIVEKRVGFVIGGQSSAAFYPPTTYGATTVKEAMIDCVKLDCDYSNVTNTGFYGNYSYYQKNNQDCSPDCGASLCSDNKKEPVIKVTAYYMASSAGRLISIADTVLGPGSYYSSNYTDCNMLVFENKTSYDGWYKYDGTQGYDTNIGVIAYAPYYTATDCAAMTGGVYKNDISKNGATVSGCFVPDIANFKPKCSSFVQGYSPWVNRLKTSLTQGALFSTTPYSSYYNLPIPFGLAQSKINGFLGILTSLDGSGFPYNCSGGDWCKYLHYDGANEFSLSVSSIGPYVSNTGSSIYDLLRQLFLKVKTVATGSNLYDFSYGGISQDIGSCTGGVRTNNAWCAIYPSISNVSLKDSSGNTINQVSKTFTITKSDFYTLSFNTTIDMEQAPISRVSIDWGDNEACVLVSNVDSKPSATDPFKFVYQLSPGNYSIRIKIEDNWNFWSCWAGSGNCNNICQ